MKKNAKIGCFEHLWLHHIHVSVQGYTISKALFDPKKNFFYGAKKVTPLTRKGKRVKKVKKKIGIF